MGAKTSGDDTGFVGGVYSGYNIQCRNIVFGVESDFNFSNMSAVSTYPDPTSQRSEIDKFGTLRARVGVTVRDDMLVYATGGWAYADISQTFDDPPGGLVVFNRKDQEWVNGYVVGAGIEFLRWERWMLRAEALYVDLGDETRRYTFSGCGGTCNARLDWDDSFWVARLGLSVKLGGHEQRPVPLK